ncbi:hypothetical protein AMECASPLE_022257, partial [Ameca splendens]
MNFLTQVAVQNLDTNALSYCPHETSPDKLIQKAHELLNQFSNVCLVPMTLKSSLMLMKQSAMAVVKFLFIMAVATPDTLNNDLHRLPIVPIMSHLKLQDKQQTDPSFREVIHQLGSREK